MIVKVQRPIFTSDEAMQQTLYIYDENRAYSEMVPATERVLKMFGDDMKMYCRAHLHKGELVIDGRAPEQRW